MAGFFVLDMLKAIRLAKSHHLDLLMREFFGYAHTGTANKTQYTQMVIMRVFWGMAMVPELSALYHQIRTVPTGNKDGGWDKLIEVFNREIKKHCHVHVSETQIRWFVHHWPFCERIIEEMRQLMKHEKQQRDNERAAIANTDVDEYQWSIAFMDTISKELCERIRIIRNRAKKYKELF